MLLLVVLAAVYAADGATTGNGMVTNGAGDATSTTTASSQGTIVHTFSYYNKRG